MSQATACIEESGFSLALICAAWASSPSIFAFDEGLLVIGLAPCRGDLGMVVVDLRGSTKV